MIFEPVSFFTKRSSALFLLDNLFEVVWLDFFLGERLEVCQVICEWIHGLNRVGADEDARHVSQVDFDYSREKHVLLVAAEQNCRLVSRVFAYSNELWWSNLIGTDDDRPWLALYVVDAGGSWRDGCCGFAHPAEMECASRASWNDNRWWDRGCLCVSTLLEVSMHGTQVVWEEKHEDFQLVNCVTGELARASTQDAKRGLT